MKIYRIEDEEGGGPWQGQAKCMHNVIHDAMHNRTFGYSLDEIEALHPIPYYEQEICDFLVPDGELRGFHHFFKIIVPYHFALPNFEQVRKWSIDQQGLRYLHQLGMMINEYEISEKDAGVSNTQVVFKKEDATYIRTVPLEEIENGR